MCSEFSSPAVCNTAGTGQWSEGDPFNNVQSSAYWSSTEANMGEAWFMHLNGGWTGTDYQEEYHYIWPVRNP